MVFATPKPELLTLRRHPCLLRGKAVSSSGDSARLSFSLPSKILEKSALLFL
jgi:hypothetical protein